jgi:hypothetical protein
MREEGQIPSTAGKAKPPAVHLVLNRWMILLLVLAIILPWLVLGALLASQNAASRNSRLLPAHDRAGQSDVPSPTAWTPADPRPQEWVVGKKGPWGQIQSMIFAIDVPDEFLVVPPANQPPVRWSFPGYSKEKVLATLRSAGLPEVEVKKWDGQAAWSSEGGVAAVEPGDALVLGLAPEVRSKLYAILAAFPQNARQIDPVWFWSGTVDWQLQDSGLAPESIALLKRLLYARGENALLFADFEPALRSLPNDAERKRFMKVLSRKRSVLARLRLDPDSDVEQISQYWGIGGRRKDAFPFLNALHRVEKGCTLNIICLLPGFPRDHLYIHPVAAPTGKGTKQGDCAKLGKLL